MTQPNDRRPSGDDDATVTDDELAPASDARPGSLGGDQGGAAAKPDAGYTGGLAEGNQGAAGMRQIVADEARDARRQGEDVETPANLGQQDQ